MRRATAGRYWAGDDVLGLGGFTAAKVATPWTRSCCFHPGSTSAASAICGSGGGDPDVGDARGEDFAAVGDALPMARGEPGKGGDDRGDGGCGLRARF